MPFMFPNYDVAIACEYGPVGKEIEKLYEKQNMLVLAWGANEFRDFSNRTHEIKTPDDMGKLKMRVPNSEMYIDLWRAMGANPVSMSWAETVGAIQTGTIDGQENGPVSPILQKSMNCSNIIPFPTIPMIQLCW